MAEANRALEQRIAERTAELEREMLLREKSQAALAQSQRLDALGQLTGGIAHDFNNLLTVVSGNLEFAKDKTVDPAIRDALLRALDAVALGARLNRRLLSFARHRTLEADRFSLNDRVQEMVRILRRSLPDGIDIRMRLGSDVWDVWADPIETDGVILNVALNARDAMPDGGTLTFMTSNITLDGEAAASESVHPGDYVCLEIEDNGRGMSSAVLRRAIEPFFSTKEVGKGTGLGLSSVYGFARQSGGFLKICSEPGIGTKVRLGLPRAQQEAPDARETDKGLQLPLGNAELILVVDDDERVRRVTLGRLEALGYVILEARNGREALDILERESDIDLVLSDIVMPGDLDGFAIAAWIRSERPGISVLLTTGDEGHRRRDYDGGNVRILPKPCSHAELARAVRRELDSGQC